MRKLKRTTKQIIFALVISIVVILTAFSMVYFVYIKQVKATYEDRIMKAETELYNNKKEVYVASSDIKQGEQITLEKLLIQEVYTSLPIDYYMTEEDISKIAIIEIPSNVPVFKNMVSDFVQNDLREEEFNVFYLNTNLNKNDYVDIRILYPNGENFIVLSKKELKNLSIENSNCFMWLDANEIHNISSAIVDAYMNEGTKLYTTKYIEPNIQDASIVTYTPNSNVIDLINNDPNVVNKAKEYLSKDVRESLDERLKQFYQDYQGEVQWEESKVPVVDTTINEEEPKEEYYYVE